MIYMIISKSTVCADDVEDWYEDDEEEGPAPPPDGLDPVTNARVRRGGLEGCSLALE